MFWDTFERLCDSVGKAPSVVASEIGIKSTGTISGWKKGAKPRASALKALSDYFGVPVSDLTGERQKEKPATESEPIGPAKQKLLDAVDDMSPAEMAILFERIQKIKESRI